MKSTLEGILVLMPSANSVVLLLQVLAVTWACKESISTLRTLSSAGLAVGCQPKLAELQSDLL